MDRDDLFGRNRGWSGDERYGDRGRRGWERERDWRFRGEGDDRYGYGRDYDERGYDRSHDTGYGASEWERDRYGRGDISRHYRRGRHEDWYTSSGGEDWRPQDRYRPHHEESWRDRWRHRLHAGTPDPWSEEYRRRQEARWRREELGVGPWLKEVVLGYEGEELPPFYGLGHHGPQPPMHTRQHPRFLERMRERLGRGPKGYKRNDERIREDVCECLVDHPWVNVDDVEVRCVDGEITLTGTVPARVDKREIEDVAHDMRGVRDVHNQLRVVRPAEAALKEEERRPTPPSERPRA
jgi:hypothetical protein